MAKKIENTKSPVDPTVNAPAIDFDNLEGAEEIVTSRPMIKWDKLAGRDNLNKSFVVAGWLVQSMALNNPKGAKRDEDFWTSYIIEVTHPTKAINEKGEEVTVLPGKGQRSEVYLGGGREIDKMLAPYLGLEEMFWIAIRPNGELDLGNGNRPMRVFDVRVGGKNAKGGALPPRKREGRYLLGGPGAHVSTTSHANIPAANGAISPEVAALNG